MIIYPVLPSGHTIFCDDIRHELGGKITFVGTYTNYLFVSGSFPIVLPKLCLGIVYREEHDSLEPVNVRIFIPGREEAIADFRMEPQAELIPPPSQEFQFREARLFFEAPNLLITEPGRIKVRAYRGDDEIRLGALAVQTGPEFEDAPGEATETVASQ